MSHKIAAVLAVLAMVVPQSASMLRAAPSTAEFDKGIAQVRAGRFSDAVITLDDLARQLAEEGGQSKLLARTYVYLSIAYLGMSQLEAARDKFLEALDTDRELKISPEEFPPRFMTFFEETMEEEEASKTATAPAEAESVTTPESEPAAGESPKALGTPEAKKGGSKMLLVLGGVGAAAGVGIAAAGGGGEAGVSPTPTPAPIPTPTPTGSLSLVSLDPPPGATIVVPADGRVDLNVEFSATYSQSLFDAGFFAYLHPADSQAICARATWSAWNLDANRPERFASSFYVPSDCPLPFTTERLHAGLLNDSRWIVLDLWTAVTYTFVSQTQ